MRARARITRPAPALARAQAAWIAAIEPWRGLGYRADALGRYLARKAQGRERLGRPQRRRRVPRSASSWSTTAFFWAGSSRCSPSDPRRAGRASGARWSSTSRRASSRRAAGSSSRATGTMPRAAFLPKVGILTRGSPARSGPSRAGRRSSCAKPAAARGQGTKFRLLRPGSVTIGALMIGQQFGNYRALSLLGEGGMGAVYLAEHPGIGRRVAVKVLHKKYIRDEQLLTRLLNEARAANAIRHPNIIEILDSGMHRRRHAVPGDGAARGREPGDAHPPRRRAADRRAPSSSATRPPRRWGPRTRRGSSTAISSRTTSSSCRIRTSPSASGSRCSTSGSPSSSRTRRTTRSRRARAR